MKKMKSILERLSVVGIAFLAFPGKVMAAKWYENPLEIDDLNELIRAVLQTAIVGASIVSVAYLIYNGIKYMVSGGDSQKTEEAQKGLANAIIGLVICLAAYLIVDFVTNMVGGDIGSLDTR